MHVSFLTLLVKFVNLNFCGRKSVYSSLFLSYSFSMQNHIWRNIGFMTNVLNQNIGLPDL